MTTIETIAMSKENPAEYLTNLTLDLVHEMISQIDMNRVYERMTEKYSELVFDDEFKEILFGEDMLASTFMDKDWLNQYMQDTGMRMAIEGNYQTMIDEFKQKEIEEEPETVM